MSPYEILTKAQDLIRDPKNWTQDVYERDHCFCIAGAIRKIALNPYPAFHFLSSLVKPTVSNREGAIIVWNDDPERTHAEVMDLFERAKEKARVSETA